MNKDKTQKNKSIKSKSFKYKPLRKFEESVSNIPTNLNKEKYTIVSRMIETYKSYCNKMKKIYIIKNLIIISFFSLSYILYYFSLEPCLLEQWACTKQYKWIKTKVIENILSALLLNLMIVGILIKKISPFHLLHTIIIFIYFYFKSHGAEFEDHGWINFLWTWVFIILLLIIQFPFIVISFLILKKKFRKIVIFIIIGLILLFSLPVIIKRKFSCKDWGKGLNNTFIENDQSKGGCIVQSPAFCSYNFFSIILDLQIQRNANCEKRKKVEKTMLKSFSKTDNINNNTKRIGYPLINKIKINTVKKLLKYTYKNLIDMDNKTQLTKLKMKNIPEIILDYTTNEYGDLKIELNFNKRLSKERKSLESKSKPLYENALIIYIDTISRAHSIRSLKKTINFIDQFTSYKGKTYSKTENYHSFQFFKYYSFDGLTARNYPVLFAGKRLDKNVKKKLITKYFKEHGYITGFFNDCCLKSGTQINMDKDEEFDHDISLCDPIAMYGIPYDASIRAYTQVKRRCLYGKEVFEYGFEFGNKFWKLYPDNRKYMQINFLEAHERTLERVKYMDNSLFNFINNLYNENLLKDTALIFLSDHGCKLPSLYYFNTGMYLREYHLPMLFMILNDKKDISYDEQYGNLNKNQQIFITGYDFYNTLGHIIYGKTILISNVKEMMIIIIVLEEKGVIAFLLRLILKEEVLKIINICILIIAHKI